MAGWGVKPHIQVPLVQNVTQTTPLKDIAITEVNNAGAGMGVAAQRVGNIREGQPWTEHSVVFWYESVRRSAGASAGARRTGLGDVMDPAVQRASSDPGGLDGPSARPAP